MTGGAFLILGCGFLIALYAMVGHLGRIADAIEAQNRSYGIGVDTPDVLTSPKKDTYT